MSLMNMSTKMILKTAENTLARNSRMVLAAHGIQLRTCLCYYLADGLNLYCILEDQGMVENIGRNPRVAFDLIGLPPGVTLRGNGIAQIVAQAAQDELDQITLKRTQNCTILKIILYRLTITDPDTGVSDSTLERRRLEWLTLSPGQRAIGEKGRLRSQLSFWLKATRSVALPMSVFPVLLGSVFALWRGSFNLWLFLATLAGVVSAQVGANLLNDYYDFKKGVDTTAALSTHPGALVNEEVEPEQNLTVAFAAFMLTSLSGGVLMALVGWPILLMGVIGLAGAYSYTGGPLPYKYKGLGELVIGFLMGPLLVMGTYFVQTGTLDFMPFFSSLAVGLLVSSVVLANNLRDIQDDRIAGITTLPMQLGISAAKKLYYVVIFLPFFVVLAMAFWKNTIAPLFLVILSLPMAYKAWKAMHVTQDSADDIRTKAPELKYPLNSIRLHRQFSVLLMVGCSIAVFLKY